MFRIFFNALFISKLVDLDPRAYPALFGNIIFSNIRMAVFHFCFPDILVRICFDQRNASL